MVICMVKSVRFWVALVLFVILAGCMITKYCRKSAQKSAVKPAQSDSPVSQASTTDTADEEQTHENFVDESTVQESNVTESLENVENVPAEYEENVDTVPPEFDASVPFITEHKVNEITKKLHEVSLRSSDLIGWIYIADSDIDYPIVQGMDNQYYLHHAPDGSYNELGTIFLSYQCSADFSDDLNILYGHNMQYGMFGDIRRFKEQEQYDKHRYGWLFTTENLYRIDFFTLSIVSAYDTIYDIPADRAEWQNSLKANSMYYTETDINDDDAVVALSTCASDFEDARALFAGKLTWIQEINIH